MVSAINQRVLLSGMTRRRSHTYCVQCDWKTHTSAASIYFCRVNIIPHLQTRNKQNITQTLWCGDLNSITYSDVISRKSFFFFFLHKIAIKALKYSGIL